MEWTRTRTRQMIGAQNLTRDTLPDWVPRSWYQGQLFILYYLCHFLYERRLHGARVLKIAGRSIDELQLSIIPWTKLKTLRTISDPRRLNPTRTGSRSQLTYPISNPTQIFSVHSTPITDSFQALNMCKTSFEYSIYFISIYIFLYSNKFHSIITRFTSNFIITSVLSM